jgi:amidase
MRLFYNLFFLLLLFTHCRPTAERDADIDLMQLSAGQLQEGYRQGKFTVTRIVQAHLDRIEAIDRNGPALNSVLYVNPHALEVAAELDRELREGKIRGPLHGVPVLLKDNIDTYDMPTTAGARALAGSVPPADSRVARRLREGGAVILGKANLSEWANFHSTFSSSGWSGLGGQTKNPYDLSRNPCGSSSGSAVAVSAGLCVIAIGTETNGSIVCPSNNNGIVGIKPTVGLISRSGIIPISHTQDTPGPMARSVRDAALCLGLLTGADPADPHSLESDGRSHADYTQFCREDALEGLRIGFYTAPSERHFRVDRRMREAVDYLKSRGAEIVEIDAIGDEDYNGPSFQVLLYEFKDGLNRYFAGLGEDAPVKSLEELIELTLSDSVEMRYFDHALLTRAQEKGDLNSREYLEALESMLRRSRQEGIDKVMDEHRLDAIAAPTGGPAWKTDLTNGDRYGVSSSSPAAIAGYPAITVPMGEIDGLPVGISFFGRAWSEDVLIGIAYAYEQGTHHRKSPQFHIPNHAELK